MVMLFIPLVFLLDVIKQIHGHSVTDGTKLISTFLVHRHGDRTPNESQLNFSTNVNALKAATAKYGYGQLTKLGKQRSYHLGKFIRSRYDELLSPQYNRSEIYIRSTDSTRTQMTILSATTAVYPAYPGSWSDEINWVPTPYTTVPVKYDILMAASNCPNFRSNYKANSMAANCRMSKFRDILDVVSKKIGSNITDSPRLVYLAYDVFISQRNLGISLDDTISNLLPDIKAAADVAVDILFGNDKLKALQAGHLLNEFFIYTAKQISGSATPRVRIYSVHDGNIYSFMAVTQITPQQGIPEYNSAFALELRQVMKTGEYVVLPVYLPSPGEDLKYLQVEGCDDLLCPYDTFKKIVSPYLLDENTWRAKCDFSEDLDIDLSGL